MKDLFSTYNNQISNIPAILQLHTDRHSDQDMDIFESGGHRHLEYDSHTDQMWDDGEED